MESTPLLSSSGVHRRQSGVPPPARRRDSVRLKAETPEVPAMGELGSFLFLSNLITGALITVSALQLVRLLA